MLHEQFGTRGWPKQVHEELLARVIDSELFLRYITHCSLDFDPSLVTFARGELVTANTINLPEVRSSAKYDRSRLRRCPSPTDTGSSSTTSADIPAGSDHPMWATRDNTFPWNGDHHLKTFEVCGLDFTKIGDWSEITPAERHRAMAFLHDALGAHRHPLKGFRFGRPNIEQGNYPGPGLAIPCFFQLVKWAIDSFR
jgi:hypothetical protein